MPFRFAPEPENGTATVRGGLNRLSARAAPQALLAAGAGALQVNPPHAIYDLRADEIANGGGLASAHATGFRYLVAVASASVAAAEVHTDASGAATLLANVNYGPFVEATARALEQLATLEEVRSGSFEARVLRFAAISLMAIWLKSDPGGADIIYPLAPAPDVLQAGKPYAVADFLKAIMPLAEKRAASKGAATVP